MAFPNVGDPAPDFTSLTDSGDSLTLSSLRGQRIVLYFYPEADTPGCTKQACTIRDNYQRFRTVAATVIGVSPDDVEKQAAFKAKYNLPFTLIADADHSVSDLYGVYGDHKIMYNGQEFTTHGTRRSTFIIEPDGVVSYSKFGVSATDNPGEIMDILEGKEAVS
jgi:peroxiredoxin Q/BCP